MHGVLSCILVRGGVVQLRRIQYEHAGFLVVRFE